MNNRMFKTETETNSELSIVTGRNGTHKLAAILVWRTFMGDVSIEGIGRSGKMLNEGFYLDADSGVAFFNDLKVVLDRDKKIIVEVRGGVAYCDDPNVEIIDYDNR